MEAAQGFLLKSKLPFHNSLIRSLRSAVASPQRSVTLTTSWTKNKIKTSSAVLQSKGNIRKRMTANHMGFKMPPHIDISRSTGNLSVMVGKQLILTCFIPNTGNESVSILLAWIRKAFITHQISVNDIVRPNLLTFIIFQVSWIRHRDAGILAVNNFVYTTSHRIKVFHQNGSSEWRLSINPVEISDDGTYECQISTTPTTFHSMAVRVVGKTQ